MKTRSPFTSIFTVLVATAAISMTAAACSSDDDDKGKTANNGPGGGGGNGGGDGKGGGEYTLDDVCEEMAKKQCAMVKPCCDASDVGYDQAGCEAAAKEGCEEQVAKVKEGKLTFDAGSVDPCLKAFEPMYAKCELSLADSGERMVEIETACRMLFAGTVAPGEACEEDEECKPSTDPEKLTFCESGKCSEGPHFLGEGKACDVDGDGRSCAPGLYCDTSEDPNFTVGTCEKMKAVGDACEGMAYGECGVGSNCDLGTQACKAGKPIGESCTMSFECASLLCNEEGKCASWSIADEQNCKGLPEEFEM